jgi:predicted negative regulator of RcsB-dependent stress response
MDAAAKTLGQGSWAALMPRSWAEWRSLVGGVLVATVGLSTYSAYQWTRWRAEVAAISQRQSTEIRELMADLRIARRELRIAQARNDLLATRRLLALARQSIETEQRDEAQTQLRQAAQFLKAVSPLALDVNAAKLERVQGELLVADLRAEPNDQAAGQRVSYFAGELDGLLGE